MVMTHSVMHELITQRNKLDLYTGRANKVIP